MEYVQGSLDLLSSGRSRECSVLLGSTGSLLTLMAGDLITSENNFKK